MRYIKGFLIWFRDFYVALMTIPLWLWSIYYRTTPMPHLAWIDNNWNTLCLLVFTHGSLALWQYTEKVANAHAQEKPASILTGSVWLLAIALFITGIGGILKSNGVFWGYGLLASGVIGTPVFVLWIIGFEIYEQKGHTTQESVQREDKGQTETDTTTKSEI